ncbi:MAG: hypothetical protein KBB55_01220 [Candidatus Buchananbacteria bacterium]|nr:hypothetical protein [Candidatus Buchananbacteria bacterium]
MSGPEGLPDQHQQEQVEDNVEVTPVVENEEVIEKEQTPEIMPTKEDIDGAFGALISFGEIDGKEFKVLKLEENDEGILKYDIEVLSKSGDKIEYEYSRPKYNHRSEATPERMRYAASIEMTLYSGDMPVSGWTVAKYNGNEGSWEFFLGKHS